MRRGGPLKRKKGLGQGSKPLKRKTGLSGGSKGLSRAKGLVATTAKRKPSKKKAVPLNVAAAEAWALGARGKACTMCGRTHLHGVVVRGHHVIYAQVVERICEDLGLDFEGRWRWDVRNRLPLCDDCHVGHHDGGDRKVPLVLVLRDAPKVLHFAAELDRLFDDGRSPAAASIERRYP